MSGTGFRAWAPGRVNLIGEHTDYSGGLVLPMAIHLGTEIAGARIEGSVRLRSNQLDGEVSLPLPLPEAQAAAVEPTWGRHVAGVAALVTGARGFDATVASTVPIGSGLSSSAALEVASALALGFRGSPRELAALCQAGSQLATGVPCGIMDQLASAAGIEGHALRIDCSTLDITPVALPEDVDVLVVHSGQERELATSAYSDRRRQCEAAEAEMGPFRQGDLDAVERLADPVLRARARHVVSENTRVDAFADALRRGDLVAAGRLMDASHASLRDDFEVSTPVLDDLVTHLRGHHGVFGARLTGAGFGGCVVALCRRGIEPAPPGLQWWRVRPGPGAFLMED